MAKTNRIYEKTPNGGAYSEIYFFNEVGENVEEKEATKCVIRECDENGNLICETWGTYLAQAK